MKSSIIYEGVITGSKYLGSSLYMPGRMLRKNCGIIPPSKKLHQTDRCCIGHNTSTLSSVCLNFIFPDGALTARAKPKVTRSNEYKIKRLIMRHYDKTTRPVRNDSTPMGVHIAISLYHILDTVSISFMQLYILLKYRLTFIEMKLHSEISCQLNHIKSRVEVHEVASE